MMGQECSGSKCSNRVTAFEGYSCVFSCRVMIMQCAVQCAVCYSVLQLWVFMQSYDQRNIIMIIRIMSL